MTTCLIVDESAVIRMVAKKILEDLQIEVADSTDFTAALAVCRSASPDVVLIERQVKETSADDFVKALRVVPGGGRVKVIYCTAHCEPADIRTAQEAGADDYIMKPFDSEVLHSKFLQLGLLPEGAL